MSHANDERILRVFLVEDNDDDHVAFSRAMRNASLTVEIIHCVRAEEALAQLRTDREGHLAIPSDVLVADYKLPGMSGLDLCLALLQRQVPIPTVLLTGVGSEHLAVRALKAGVSDYLIKDIAGGYLTLLPVVLLDVVRRFEDRVGRQRAEIALRQHNRELALLNGLGQELAATLDREAIIRRLLAAVTETLDAEGASLWMWADSETVEGVRDLVCRGFFNVDRGGWFPIDLHLSSEYSVASWVATHGRSVVLPQAREDPRFFSGVDQITGLHTVSILAMPLRGRGGVVGTLEVVNKRRGSFAEDLTVVETLASSAVIALDNALLVDELRQRSDELQLRNDELQTALDAIKTLSGLVPICAWCGSKIQNDDGDWIKIETYIEEHSQAEFTHGICPECLVKWKGKDPREP